LLGPDATTSDCATIVQLLFVLRRAEPLPAERVNQGRMFFQALFQRASLLLLRFTTCRRRLTVVLRVVVVVVVTVVVVVVVDNIVVDGVYVYIGRQHHGYATAGHDVGVPALGQLLVCKAAERELGRAGAACHGRVHGLSVFGADTEHGSHGRQPGCILWRQARAFRQCCDFRCRRSGNGRRRSRTAVIELLRCGGGTIDSYCYRYLHRRCCFHRRFCRRYRLLRRCPPLAKSS